MEFDEPLRAEGVDLFRQVLSSSAYQKRCNIPVKLIPVLHRVSTLAERSMILKLLEYHHKMFDLCVERIDTYDPLPGHLDQASSASSSTFREVLMALRPAPDSPECLLFSIDRKWNSPGFTVTAPKAFADKAKNIILGIVPYVLAHFDPATASAWFVSDSLGSCEQPSVGMLRFPALPHRATASLDAVTEDAEMSFWFDTCPFLPSTSDRAVYPARPPDT